MVSRNWRSLKTLWKLKKNGKIKLLFYISKGGLYCEFRKTWWNLEFFFIEEAYKKCLNQSLHSWYTLCKNCIQNVEIFKFKEKRNGQIVWLLEKWQNHSNMLGLVFKEGSLFLPCATGQHQLFTQFSSNHLFVNQRIQLSDALFNIRTYVMFLCVI